MEAEPIVLPDNTVLDTSKPPPGFNFPKPDFSPVTTDEPSESAEKNEAPVTKPTFKSALQAKKRLQAFSSARPSSLPSSPSAKKAKPDEKNDDAFSTKKTPKKGNYHDDKAKAVIEEIEELKRAELHRLTMMNSTSRSRSRSQDKERFKKVEKKTRNYRRRSPTLEKPRKVIVKKPKRYPKNWHEFVETEATFDLNRDFEISPPKGNNELLRQILFESPSLAITQFKMKTANKEDKIVPFEYIRYTRAKPVVPYSVNHVAIKEKFLPKKLILDALPKDTVNKIEYLYSNSLKFKLDSNHKKKTRTWFPKVWKDSENECKLLEKSVGLSFLQTYTGEEEETEFVEEIEEKPVKEEEKVEVDSKKKKKKIKEPEEKKRQRKERKKIVEGGAKKKRKKDKKKKLKQSKEKKIKPKKVPKDKKKKDKSVEEEEKPNKQQVIEELKKIEEKLAKKRELESKAKAEKKPPQEKEEKSRKRKHSEREDNAKRAKHEVKIKSEEKPKVKMEEEKNRNNRKKSRWSEPAVVKEEAEEYTNSINIEEEIKRIDEVLKKHEKFTEDQVEELKPNEPVKEKTPDTEEYHSHWESDDDLAPSVRHQSVKLNRSWESDEELFERTYNRNKPPSEDYANLEIPLNIKTFSRRGKWEEKPPYLDTVTEFKLLEEERRNLSEERRKLELEKQKILKMQEEAKLLEVEEKKMPEVEPPKRIARSSTPEIKVAAAVTVVKKEKNDMVDFSFDSLNNSLLSNVSSTESNFPIAMLENEYEEFIKAVNSDASVVVPKRKQTSSSSSSSSSDSDHKKKRRKKKKKKKKKSGRDHEGGLIGKNIFDEFDIPVPSDLPEMVVPTPVPVPTPIATATTTSLLINPMVELKENPPPEEPSSGLDLTKPFVFSSIVLPTKKPPLVTTSISLQMNDDSDSADFTDKFVKKPDTRKAEDDVGKEEEEIVEEKEPEKREEVMVEEAEPKKTEEIMEVVKKIEEEPNQLLADKPKLEEKEMKTEVRRSGEKLPKKRSRSRSREREVRRRSPIRRRDASPPPRRRYSSPRRRTPPRRRRSPSPRSPRRRMSSPLPRRRRRSPHSLSPPPPRSRRKRTPSPRIRRAASPLNSPLDGFKRSVADSTISDDMLPQPAPDDYVESPPTYHHRKSKRGSVSPPVSPKRIPLDDRINQVLGLEKNEPSPPKPPPEAAATAYPSYGYYGPQQQYGQYPGQYGQFGVQKNEYVAAAAFAGPMYTQPPPPIVKPKVVQVGNILQVVPTEEIPQSVVETKPQETSQKIVQVGNMLQIVPAAVIPPPPPSAKPPPVVVEVPVQQPEKQSAEAVMKQKAAERKAERERRRQERERRRKEKEKKRKEKERRRQMKLKIKTENMIKRAIQLEAEALASEDLEEEGEGAEAPVQWPPVSVVVSGTPSCNKGILVGGEGTSKKRKSVQFADGVRPGEGTSPSGGEELSSPPPNPQKLPKEKRYKKLKVPKKSKKKKIKVKVVKRKVQSEDEEEDDEEDNLPPPSPPPGSPPPHVFPSRVKTHTINNVHQYVGNIIQSGAAAGFPFRPPMAMAMAINRHQPPPPGFIPGTYHHSDVSGLTHQPYQGVSSHH